METKKEENLGDLPAYTPVALMSPEQVKRELDALKPLIQTHTDLTGEELFAVLDGFLENPIIEKAVQLGILAHRQVNHMRKYTKDVPYIVHPLAVAANLSKTVQSLIDQQQASHLMETKSVSMLNIDALKEGRASMVAAAILHDTLEDTRLTEQEIAQHCGAKTLELVQGLTDQYTHAAYPKVNRANRKALENLRTAQEKIEVHIIKLCDLHHNYFDLQKNDPDFFKAYRWEKRALLDAMKTQATFKDSHYLRAETGMQAIYNSLMGRARELLDGHVAPDERAGEPTQNNQKQHPKTTMNGDLS